MAIGNAMGEGISATEGIVSRTGASLMVDTGQTSDQYDSDQCGN